MNKKVLSAILFSALFAGTGTFTSCIDNDEPAGIEELRGAKAELLRAQKLVAEADAAFKLAKAEVKKAEAAKKMAEAKIAEAQAEFEAARADSMGSAAGMAEIAYKEALAEYEREAELAMKQHELDKISKDSALAVAERQFQIAVAQIKIAQALMSEEASLELDSLITRRDTAYAHYLTAINTYETEYASYLKDYAYYKVDSTYAIRKTEIDVEEKKAALVAAEEKLAKYEKYLNSDSIYNAETWRKEIADLEKKIADYDKQIAVFAVDSGRKLNGEDYKNLVLAEEAAEKALRTELDSLKDLKFAEDVVDTLMYASFNTTTDKKNQIYTYAKDSKKAVAVASLAGDKYLEVVKPDSVEVKVAEEYAATSLIAKLDAEIGKYTKETKYWLDSIADMDETAKAAAKAKAEEALKLYTDALAAYKAATPAADLTKLAKAASDAKTKFDTDYAAAGTDATKKKAAAEAYRKALSAWYTAAAKNGMTFNKFALPAYDATGTLTGGSSKGLNEWINDATNGASYLMMMIDGKDNLFTVVTSAYFITDNSTAETAKVTIGTSKDLATSINAAIVNVAQDLLQPLKDASEIAFGKVDNYVNTSLPAGASQDGYLHNQPDSIDFEAVYRAKGPGAKISKIVGTGTAAKTYEYYENMGIYGYSKLALSDNSEFVAKNYEAIIADLQAAKDKWTALVNEIVAETKAAAADVKKANDAEDVAEKAVGNFKTAVKQEYDKNTAGLVFSKKYWENQLISLKAAVNAFLDVDIDGTTIAGNGYTGEKAFKTWLESQIKTLEGKEDGSLVDLEEQLADAEAKLELAKQGLFDATAIQKEIETAAKELAEAQAEMEACKAAYEKAQADFDLAWKIWSEFFAAE